ncbi:phosphoglycerate kinase [Thermanaerovibrio acidaminovorans]|jgi:phosphoglycerate kinase|uniref:Phosphoglycerate kinase n=1 Tax=Thermanaerovibrio acidaminovorans (strain ATCC 49978 / DSM 6589 / Su883) TaxID=525903 RepID=D1BA20_THEAS|nr:phosphoglycerate kinase [Thermanaerovibrio acidaminovorans]ACZ19123.1 Phosphoglycerate kinase [Thermanaerovibrio acidaminovorans DSM 6589]
MSIRTFSAHQVRGKRVLLRVDFNVPMKDGRVYDDTRIRAHLRTIEALRDAGAVVCMASHLGRPKGKRNMEFSLGPVRDELVKLTGWKVRMAEDCVGDPVKDALASLEEGEMLLLENLRFHPEEEKNDPEFARLLAEPFDVFVMDAFSAAHRAHASTRGVADHLETYAGYLMEQEIAALSKVRDNPDSPFVLILGGAKVSDKIGVIDNMLDKVQTILVGGGMAFTFLKAQGHEIGKSLCEEDKVEFARSMMEKASSKGISIVLPSDVVVADQLSPEAQPAVVEVGAIPSDKMGLDVGPGTADAFGKVIAGAKTILWNGPMGVFEIPQFAHGTKKVAEAIAVAVQGGAVSVVGGGDSAAAVAAFNMEDKVGHVSTGGGASLEFFEGKGLPGVEILLD